MESAIVLYPNPSSDAVHIQMPSTTNLEKVIVYNSLGQKVMEANELEFSVATLAVGVHYVDIQTAEGTYHKKFIKK